jgi:hypothetical protein
MPLTLRRASSGAALRYDKGLDSSCRATADRSSDQVIPHIISPD